MTINSVGNTSPTGTDETSHNSAGNGRDFNQTLEVTRQAQNLPETHANQATLLHDNKTKAPPKKETPKAPAAKKPPPKKTDVKSTEIALKKYPSSTKLKDLCDNWLDQDTQDYIGGHIKGKDVRYGTFKDHPGKLHDYTCTIKTPDGLVDGEFKCRENSEWRECTFTSYYPPFAPDP